MIGEEGQNILVITSSKAVHVPRYEPGIPEQEYLDALVDAVKTELGRDPEVIHIFKHENLLGMCAT